MKNPFSPTALPFDAEGIHATIQRALASAGMDTTCEPMRGVTDTIRRALASGGLDRVPNPGATDRAIDITARVVERGDAVEPISKPAAVDHPLPGTFERREYRNRAGARAYMLHVPASAASRPRPMLVMLHGCTQTATDFAAATQMNRLADAHGLLVVYPEQAAEANRSRCWNWFQANDQVRDAGEPSLIAGIVHDVMARHDVDPRRIFVAGLSAGAAMAVILGETYPELFAGVGVHCGLPYGSANDIPSAMHAMKGGRGRAAALNGLPSTPASGRRKALQALPTIVFHGDRDHTVQQSNGAEVVRQAIDAYEGAGATALGVSTERATSPLGRSYTRTVHADANGQPRIESWTLHGAGHAWSGGSASGSYTDPTGPDASAEMLRFFLALHPAGSA